MATYRAVIEQDADGFSVVFPDFPGCVSGGDTEEQTLDNAAEALSFHIEGMIDDGDAIPAPSRLSDPLPEWCRSYLAMVLVPVDLPGRSVRVNITLDERLLAKIDGAAKSKGMARSAFLSAGAKLMLAGG
ncbi:MAG: type II toxin-antitoxin system HicB family antitoxin [Geminicoccaceae bacterium]